MVADYEVAPKRNYVSLECEVKWTPLVGQDRGSVRWVCC